jgi:3'-phosphoadenosine 5'-phosphosulfate sulfotransferase
MASSVSSERAFSQGGITVSKLRNRLKGDLVEALQCIKCAIRHDLLFKEVAPSSKLEAEVELDSAGEDENGEGNDDADMSDDMGWDELLIEEDNDSS